jgi:hypothetical protein
MGERYAACAARRRLKTALASVYPYAVPFNLTEIMRTLVASATTRQPTSFSGGSQELAVKICIMQVNKGLSTDRKYVRFRIKLKAVDTQRGRRNHATTTTDPAD